MKRLLFLLLLTPLPGCAAFDDTYYEDGGQEWLVPTSGGCQSATVSAIPSASGILPTITQAPASQTREPDLASPGR
jgi:hypothetical protein